MITKALENAFRRMHEKGWDRIFWLVDIHDVVLLPNYDDYSTEITCPEAVEVLKYLTEREDMVLIMWTCSTEESIAKYTPMLEELGIRFNYVNENPEVRNVTTADFTNKMYTNVLLDDKAGFDWRTDWILIKEYFKI